MIPCVAGAEIVILEDDEYGEGEGSSRSAEAPPPAIPPATPGPSAPPTRVLWSDVMADLALHGHVAPVYVEPDYASEALGTVESARTVRDTQVTRVRKEGMSPPLRMWSLRDTSDRRFNITRNNPSR